MKKLTKLQFIVILVAQISVGFTTGYFIGRQTTAEVVTVEKLPMPTAPLASADPLSQNSAPDDTASLMVNINTATALELTQLPGVGEVLAGRIIEYRQTNGAFLTIYDITDIAGIGEKTLEEIEAFITVS